MAGDWTLLEAQGEALRENPALQQQWLDALIQWWRVVRQQELLLQPGRFDEWLRTYLGMDHSTYQSLLKGPAGPDLKKLVEGELSAQQWELTLWQAEYDRLVRFIHRFGGLGEDFHYLPWSTNPHSRPDQPLPEQQMGQTMGLRPEEVAQLEQLNPAAAQPFQEAADRLCIIRYWRGPIQPGGGGRTLADILPTPEQMAGMLEDPGFRLLMSHMPTPPVGRDLAQIMEEVWIRHLAQKDGAALPSSYGGPNQSLLPSPEAFLPQLPTGGGYGGPLWNPSLWELRLGALRRFCQDHPTLGEVGKRIPSPLPSPLPEAADPSLHLMAGDWTLLEAQGEALRGDPVLRQQWLDAVVQWWRVVRQQELLLQPGHFGEWLRTYLGMEPSTYLSLLKGPVGPDLKKLVEGEQFAQRTELALWQAEYDRLVPLIHRFAGRGEDFTLP